MATMGRSSVDELQQGIPGYKIEEQLIAKGIPEAQASEILELARISQHSTTDLRKRRELAIGFGAIAVGVLISTLTFLLDQAGNSLIVFYGLVVFGIVQIVKAFH